LSLLDSGCSTNTAELRNIHDTLYATIAKKLGVRARDQRGR